MNKWFIVGLIQSVFLIVTSSSIATVVTVIQDPAVSYQWSVSEGTPTIVDVAGEGGAGK